GVEQPCDNRRNATFYVDGAPCHLAPRPYRGARRHVFFLVWEPNVPRRVTWMFPQSSRLLFGEHLRGSIRAGGTHEAVPVKRPSRSGPRYIGLRALWAVPILSHSRAHRACIPGLLHAEPIPEARSPRRITFPPSRAVRLERMFPRTSPCLVRR